MPKSDPQENKFQAALKDEPAPSHDEHGEDSWDHPISEKMTQAHCWNWRMVGNMLHCDSDFGPLAQTMPTNVICLGEKDGLPILKELVL